MRKLICVAAALAAGWLGAAQEDESRSFTFASWNIGHFALGRSSASAIPLGEAAAKGEEYRKFLAEVKADVIGVCEFSEAFATNGALSAGEIVFRDYAGAVIGPAHDYQWNAQFLRRGTILGSRVHEYERHCQGVYYLETRVRICGEEVVFVATHLDWGNPAVRATQMQELVTRFKDVPRVVISGDFNQGVRYLDHSKPDVDNPVEYRVFTDAGFTLGNDGRYKTHPTEADKAYKSLDNIIVKGLELHDFKVWRRADLSDHALVSAVLSIPARGVVNPLVRQNAPDPFTAYDATSGWYYHLHTENPTDGSGGFSSDRVVLHRARHAGDLLRADESRVVYQANAADGVGGFLWAPEMHRASNGKWYIYTTCARRPEGGVKRLLVLEAKADDPFDGFRLKSFPDETIFAIDPTVFTAKDGRQYMCYSQVKPEKGQVLQIREMASPWSFGARQAELAFAELPWECVPPYDKSRILEGAFFVTSPVNGSVFIVYSANGCWSQGYCLGVLDHLGGDLCEAKNWKKRTAPVFASGNGVYGPGHAAFFRSPDEKELWVSYHFLADENPSNGPTDRLFALQRFNVDETTGGPAQTVPVRPGTQQLEPSGCISDGNKCFNVH